MKIKMKHCGIAAVIAVAALLIFSGVYFTEVSASYTPANPVIASWDAQTNIPKNVSSGAWTLITGSPQNLGVLMAQSSAALGDDLRWSVEFPDTATHTLYVTAQTDSNRGIISLWINGVNQTASSVDLYSGGTVSNVILSMPIKPDRVGKNVMMFEANSKNAASTNYFMPITEWWII